MAQTAIYVALDFGLKLMLFLKIGHRGAAGYEPENTLRSFKKALKLGVDMIELDVHVCASGELVVIHDEDVDRTTNGRGLVAQKTFKELRKLNAGQGQKIPTLNQVLNLIDQKARVNIELKGRGTAVPVARLLVKYVEQRRWTVDDFLVSSLNHRELAEFARLAAGFRIGVLLTRLRKRLNVEYYLKKFRPWSINLSKKIVTAKRVRAAHRQGVKVLVWTVDKPNEIQKIINMGVDGIFSNFPDRL